VSATPRKQPTRSGKPTPEVRARGLVVSAPAAPTRARGAVCPPRAPPDRYLRQEEERDHASVGRLDLSRSSLICADASGMAPAISLWRRLGSMGPWSYRGHLVVSSFQTSAGNGCALAHRPHSRRGERARHVRWSGCRGRRHVGEDGHPKPELGLGEVGLRGARQIGVCPATECPQPCPVRRVSRGLRRGEQAAERMTPPPRARDGQRLFVAPLRTCFASREGTDFLRFRNGF
jgi:hypothetical protein